MSDPAKPADGGITIEVKDYALDHVREAAAARIAERLMPKVEEMIERRIDAILDETWQATVGAKAKEAIEAFLSKPRTRTDSWGNSISTEVLADRIPRVVEEYMAQRVNSKGSPETGYGSDKYPTRMEWLLKTAVTDELRKETEKAAKDVTEKARAVVAQHVGRFISEQMVPAIDVQKR